MLARLAVGVPLFIAAVALLWWGPAWLWSGVTFIMAAIAAWEWARLGGLPSSSAAWYAGFFSLLAFGGKTVLDNNLPAADMLFGGICVFWVLLAPLAILSDTQRIRRELFLAAGLLLIFSAWYAAVNLFVNDLYALLSALIIVWTADSAAYFTGKKWGKTPMAPFVSPGKTWEGFFGGMSASLAVAYFAGPLLFFAPPVWLSTAAFAVVALSVLGDLFESAIKRRSGAKDSGTILGSHGGMLDRMDALLPSLPFAALISSWLT